MPPSTPGIAKAAIEKACIGCSVLCVANTVAQAQHWFREIKADMPEGAFEIGLLHSKFPAWRRAELEAYWMHRLGKDGDRSQGCVLVATQIVEQSVDIDADLMLTELAPTDMLLQRIGRLWRHPRDHRPIQTPRLLLISNDLDDVSSLEELVETLGKANSLVYSPYVLWQSYRVWSSHSSVELPGGIRALLEATYPESLPNAPTFIHEARKKLEQRKEKLRSMAYAARADARGFCTMKDDERAATRYNELPMIDVLLAKSIDSLGDEATLTLSNGEIVALHRYTWDRAAMAQLHKNLVSIPKHKMPNPQSPPYLGKYFYEATPVLAMDASGELRLDGIPTGFRYDNTLGLQQEQPHQATSSKKEGRHNTEYTDFDEWEGGFDEFSW